MRGLYCFLSVIAFCVTDAFQSPFGPHLSIVENKSERRRLVIHMGRAAAVRAATKAKTDAAKAKNNGRYAKKIIMAVKAGGTINFQ
jgi:hypothetical protein